MTANMIKKNVASSYNIWKIASIKLSCKDKAAL